LAITGLSVFGVPSEPIVLWEIVERQDDDIEALKLFFSKSTSIISVRKVYISQNTLEKWWYLSRRGRTFLGPYHNIIMVLLKYQR